MAEEIKIRECFDKLRESIEKFEKDMKSLEKEKGRLSSDKYNSKLSSNYILLMMSKDSLGHEIATRVGINEDRIRDTYVEYSMEGGEVDVLYLYIELIDDITISDGRKDITLIPTGRLLVLITLDYVDEPDILRVDLLRGIRNEKPGEYIFDYERDDILVKYAVKLA